MKTNVNPLYRFFVWTVTVSLLFVAVFPTASRVKIVNASTTLTGNFIKVNNLNVTNDKQKVTTQSYLSQKSRKNRMLDAWQEVRHGT